MFTQLRDCCAVSSHPVLITSRILMDEHPTSIASSILLSPPTPINVKATSRRPPRKWEASAAHRAARERELGLPPAVQLAMDVRRELCTFAALPRTGQAQESMRGELGLHWGGGRGSSVRRRVHSLDTQYRVIPS